MLKAPETDDDAKQARLRAIEAIREFRRAHLGQWAGLDVREMMNEGRRF